MATANNSEVPVNVNSNTGKETGVDGQVLATNTNEIVVPKSETASSATAVSDTQSYGNPAVTLPPISEVNAAPATQSDTQSYGTPAVTSPPLSSLTGSPPAQTLNSSGQPALSFAGINVNPPTQQLSEFPPATVEVSTTSLAGVQYDLAGLPIATEVNLDQPINRGDTGVAALAGIQVQATLPSNSNTPVTNTGGYTFPGVVQNVDIALQNNVPIDPVVDPSIPVVSPALPGIVVTTPAPVPDAAIDNRVVASTVADPGAIRYGTTGVPVNEALPGIAAGTTLPIVGNDNPTNDFNTLVTAAKNNAISQPSIDSQRRQTNTRDWRVRLSLAPNAPYLYNAAASGDLLFPLRLTDGIIFPYTPQITTNYNTNYTKTPLTHSNYQGLFYQNSIISSITMQTTFTAQDTLEANYLLACIHFLRTAGKMFYGQDDLAGSPPPLLYLNGFGEFQFNNHPVVLENFTYTLPADVDYIRARSTNQVGINLLTRRDRQQATPYNSIASVSNRLKQLYEITTGLFNKVSPGANPMTQTSSGQGFEIGGDNPTYVPTKMEFSLTLLPINTRTQVSKQFSVTEFARGNLLRGGFW